MKERQMKDQEEIWVVMRKNASLRTAIRCELGKGEAKEVRKEMQQRHGGEWMSKKTTTQEIDAS